MKCPQCGNEIANDSIFCCYCGTKVEAETTTAPPDSILRKYLYTADCKEDEYYVLYHLYAVPKDAAQEAFSDIMSIAQSNIPDAACLLGFCFEHGIGVEQNDDLASRYYFYAANGKSVPALRRLGDVLMYAEFGETQNSKQALEYLLQIENVESNASFKADVLKTIGMIYSLGDDKNGLQSSPSQAENYYLKSISLGDYDAMHYLARLYLSRVHTYDGTCKAIWPDGISKAEQILQKMEYLGVLKHDDAHELAVAYDDLMSEVYIPAALKWYDKAIDLWFDEDDAPAGTILFEVEYIYQRGKMVNSDLQVKKDLKKAYELYKAIYNKLCQYSEENYLEDDVIDAIMHVASVIGDLSTNQYYEDRNYFKMKWLNLAAEMGNEEAKNEIDGQDSYYAHYIPLIKEENLFELYASNQLQ